MRQRRAYGDNAFRITPEQYLFPNRSYQHEESEEQQPAKRTSWSSRTTSWKPYGIGSEDVGPTASNAAIEQEDVTLANERIQNAMWEGFEQVEEEAQDLANAGTTLSTLNSAWLSSEQEPLLDIDYASELTQALASNAPDTVARCLYAAERKNDVEFIRSIPRTTFSECIRILQPSNFIVLLASEHVEMSEVMAKQLGFTPIDEVAWQHSKVLRHIVDIRRFAGIQVSFKDYRMLLRSARDLGDRFAANQIWHLLLSDGWKPDTACYNYMMASNVWHGVLQSHPRHRTRVVRFFQLARQIPRPNVAFANYRVGKGGLKEQVMRVFSDMLKHGAIANEESFCNIIMAAAREGDLSTVKSIVRKVWEIDIDALVAGKNEAEISSKEVHENSPLQPTSKVLFALAHAFSINNDIPTALRLVDFVARRYDVEVSFKVWRELFEWTFVLANPRTGEKARTDDTKFGQLPKQSVLSLWYTMTGPPYFIKPTMGMYNHLIKNLQHRDHTPELYEKMWEGRQLYYASVRESRLAFEKLKQATGSGGHATATSLENLRRNFEFLDIIRKRNFFWCKRWLRLFLSTLRSFNRVDKQSDWALREIPRTLWEWRQFLPAVVKYNGESGLVELTTRSQAEVGANRIDLMERKNARDAVLQKVPLFTSENWVTQKRSTAWRHSPRRSDKSVQDRGEVTASSDPAMLETSRS